MAMCKILFGETFLENNAVVTGNINGNSPLVWDETMLGAMRAFCAHNQPVLCSPFVLGGAKSGVVLLSKSQANVSATVSATPSPMTAKTI